MQNKFLLFVDERFRKSADRELRSMFGKTSEEKIEGRFSIIKINKSVAKVVDKVYKTRPTFIDNLIPMLGTVDFKDSNYTPIARLLQKNLNKDKTFKIEVMNLDSEAKDNAKTIEVWLGNWLESKGFKADLKEPDRYVYIILNKRTAFVGKLYKNIAIDLVLDHFRNEAEASITRSEFKLDEAMHYFRLDISRIKTALDIGAAPGGWTAYLARGGVKVFAIDNAELDYKTLKKLGKVQIYKKGADISDIDIVHIKQNVQKIDMKLLKGLGKFDGLYIDMNTAPKESANIAKKFADLLNKRARLILTIKLVDMRADKYIKEASAILKKKYSILGVKKLAHNRQEVTLCAMRK